jgi:C-terminal, D2-small domain, of ClpB protein
LDVELPLPYATLIQAKPSGNATQRTKSPWLGAKREELDEVLEIELSKVQNRVLATTTWPFLFRITEGGREFLLQEGTDQRYGARHLKRAIERYVVYPIARILATSQVHQGDVLLIDRHPGENGLAFLCDTKSRFSNSLIVPTGGNTGQLRAAQVPIS